MLARKGQGIPDFAHPVYRFLLIYANFEPFREGMRTLLFFLWGPSIGVLVY